MVILIFFCRLTKSLQTFKPTRELAAHFNTNRVIGVYIIYNICKFQEKLQEVMSQVISRVMSRVMSKLTLGSRTSYLAIDDQAVPGLAGKPIRVSTRIKCSCSDDHLCGHFHLKNFRQI